MRDIDTIIIHCADTPDEMDIGRSEIDQWHKDRGWNGIGYHYVIRRDGKVEDGRPIEKVGAHCLGRNTGSIGICLVGRVSFALDQFKALRELVFDLAKKYDAKTVAGHRDFDPHKTCPNFEVSEWWADVREVA